MNKKSDMEALRAEIERGHFSRAALLATYLGLPKEEIQDLRLKALWQMSAFYRNAAGTKRLAQDYGFSKEDLKELLEKTLDEQGKGEDDRAVKSCYDLGTEKYLSLEEWMALFLKSWDRLSVY